MSDLQYHVDGDLVPADEATVSVRDRGFTLGDAAYEAVRVYGGELFEWDAHAARLQKTCGLIGLDHDISDDDLRDRVLAVLDANDFDDAVVRLSLTRGVPTDERDLLADPDPTVVVTAKPLPRGGLDGEPVWDEPARLQTVSTRHTRGTAIPAQAKTHSRLNAVLAELELDDDATEAIILDDDGFVTEGTTCNLFFVADDALRTAGTALPILPGVTRNVVLDIAREEGVPVRTGRYTPAEYRAADEVFLTSTTREVKPVDSVDGTPVEPGPVTELLRRRFDERVESLY